MPFTRPTALLLREMGDAARRYVDAEHAMHQARGELVNLVNGAPDLKYFLYPGTYISQVEGRNFILEVNRVTSEHHNTVEVVEPRGAAPDEEAAHT